MICNLTIFCHDILLFYLHCHVFVEMMLYGVCPARNHLSLVICEQCHKSITPQGLQQHYGMPFAPIVADVCQSIQAMMAWCVWVIVGVRFYSTLAPKILPPYCWFSWKFDLDWISSDNHWYLARSANLPEGLYILPSVVSFFLYILF